VNDNDDIDFENIKEIMNQHVTCIDSNLPTVKHLLEKINDNAKNILPSLNNFNKEELLRDIQKYSATLKDISDRADKSKENLQKNLDIWNSYCSLYNSINNLLGKVKKDEPITTTDKLKEFLQKLNEKINTIQVCEILFYPIIFFFKIKIASVWNNITV
jgi:tRNA nucleotidyltransferase/poly(A) polymerase